MLAAEQTMRRKVKLACCRMLTWRSPYLHLQGIADAKQIPSDVDIRDILDRLKAHVNSSATSLRSLFTELDTASSGALDFQCVFLLIKKLMPSLSTR